MFGNFQIENIVLSLAQQVTYCHSVKRSPPVKRPLHSYCGLDVVKPTMHPVINKQPCYKPVFNT